MNDRTPRRHELTSSRGFHIATVIVAAGAVGVGCGNDGDSLGTDAGPGTCAWGMSAAGTCDDAVQVAGGGRHTCALRASGAVVCWGLDNFGQLGDGIMGHATCSTFDCSLAPVTVSGVTGAVEVSAGRRHTCARRASGEVLCWGLDADGQLGDGAMSHSGCGEPAVPGVCSLAPVAVVGLTDAVQIAAGGDSTCARRASGAVVCWGANFVGQLGDGTDTHATCVGGDCSLVPVAVAGLTDAVEISAGGSHTCARRASGAVVCWGNGTSSDGRTSLTPVAVSGLTDAVEIAAGGGEHNCARRASGGVVCWGDNTGGQLGNGAPIGSRTPVPVSGLTDAVEIAAGLSHSCARRATGAVLCWGYNGYGELGDGSGMDQRTPVAVQGLTDTVEIAAGWFHTCARRASGEIVCWGSGGDGALGDGLMSHGMCRADGMPVDCRPTPAGVVTPP